MLGEEIAVEYNTTKYKDNSQMQKCVYFLFYFSLKVTNTNCPKTFHSNFISSVRKKFLNKAQISP